MTALCIAPGCAAAAMLGHQRCPRHQVASQAARIQTLASALAAARRANRALRRKLTMAGSSVPCWRCPVRERQPSVPGRALCREHLAWDARRRRKEAA